MQDLLIGIAASVIVVVVMQAIKLFGIENSAARWVAVILSFLAAVLAHLATGGTLPPISDPGKFLEVIGPWLGGIFALATLIYHEVLKRLGWLGAERADGSL